MVVFNSIDSIKQSTLFMSFDVRLSLLIILSDRNIERASTSHSLVRIPISNESLYHATQKKNHGYSTSISMPTTQALIRAGIDIDVNIESMSAAKQQLLAELCEKQKCDVLCVQETHQGLKAIRPNIRGMSLVAEIPHEQYGSSIFVRNNCICDSTSTSNTNNVEIIQAQLNKLTVTSVYKPPNEQFSFGSNLASTQMNVVIGDFNSHGVEWGYRNTDENGRLVEQWSETNQLSLVHDAKQPKVVQQQEMATGLQPRLSLRIL